MSDDLLSLPDLPPAWKIHAGILGIETEQNEDGGWTARIEMFGEVESEPGDTEQQAVNLLIFRLKL